MSSSENDPLVWIDCEMTGLDLQQDALVEIAVIVTDSDLNPLGEGIDLIIKPPAAALEGMNDFVRSMHTTSGLLEELDGGIPLAEAEARVLAYVKQFCPTERKAILAGNSVHTDKSFLDRDMPELMSHLHYRIVDVSSLKELARRWYPRAYYNAPKKEGGHRAMADILESIQELAYYRDVLLPAPPGPSMTTCKRAARRLLAERDQRAAAAGVVFVKAGEAIEAAEGAEAPACGYEAGKPAGAGE
ncbi:oligoribonuclease [Buchananella felis]|uniref:oligoribonuclease n=1 Tax=Buchananella felis TaxID=3231492 RepID=UPI0035278827